MPAGQWRLGSLFFLSFPIPCKKIGPAILVFHLRPEYRWLALPWINHLVTSIWIWKDPIKWNCCKSISRDVTPLEMSFLSSDYACFCPRPAEIRLLLSNGEPLPLGGCTGPVWKAVVLIFDAWIFSKQNKTAFYPGPVLPPSRWWLPINSFSEWVDTKPTTMALSSLMLEVAGIETWDLAATNWLITDY